MCDEVAGKDKYCESFCTGKTVFMHVYDKIEREI